MVPKHPVRLPALADRPEPSGPPSLEQARAALGGPGRAGPRVGFGVVVEDPRHGPTPGVVVHDGGGELDVWIGESVIARVRLEHVVGSLKPTPPARFGDLAQDVLRFAQLREGQAVSVLGPGPTFDAILRERCRYGALVEREGSERTPLLAVGFRRLVARKT